MLKLSEFYNSVVNSLNFNHKKSVYYVSDNNNWSFYWDAHYITEGLKSIGLPTQVSLSADNLKNQIVHFGNRYAYLNGNFRSIDPSNKVFLTWFHGKPNDPRPHVRELFINLLDAVDCLEKIVVSCENSRSVLLNWGIPETKLITIPLGIDLEQFYPSVALRQAMRNSLNIPERAFCIGSFQKDGVGWEDGFEPKLEKGPDIFLGVIEKLARQYQNLFVLLTGPARGYVKQGLEKIGIPYVHHYLSDYHDIARYYQALDLYIIASRDEGGPKALLESWATGVPIVSTLVGMSADAIQHGKNGMLAPVEDVESLSTHAAALIENPTMRENCSRQALTDVRQYDWSLIAEQYYRQLYQPFLN